MAQTEVVYLSFPKLLLQLLNTCAVEHLGGLAAVIKKLSAQYSGTIAARSI